MSADAYLRSVLRDVAWALRNQPAVTREDIAGVIDRVLETIDTLEGLALKPASQQVKHMEGRGKSVAHQNT